MDSFDKLILVVIAIVIDQVIKRARAKKKSQEQEMGNAPETDSTYESENESYNEDYEEEAPAEPTMPTASRKLQEYIKQFEEAQREAAQGTLEPPVPPSIPEKPHHNVGNSVTMREVAEDVILMDCIDAEYLMEEFEMSEGTAISMLAELQRHRIVGRDMGDGECDVLVHDELELDNLLSREFNEVEKNSPATATAPSSSDKQSQLKILEERARKAREEAAAAARQRDRENGYTGEAIEIADPLHKRTTVRSISRESVRRGFIWSKVIDEPRFKRRWSPAHR